MTSERHTGTLTLLEKEESPYVRFLKEINRPDLEHILTPKTPWMDFTMEVYLQDRGIVGGGGLGMVRGDMALDAQELGIPFAMFTPFYPRRMRQAIDSNFWQQDILTDPVTPEQMGFSKIMDTTIRTAKSEPVVGVYKRSDLPIYALYHPSLKYVYPGENHYDIRIFQQALLGFGAIQASKELGFDPPMMQFDEAVTVFGEIAALDEICQQGASVEEAKAILKQKTLLTNHTNVPAAIATFSRAQFERFSIPNIKTSQVRSWLRDLIDANGGYLNQSVPALELSGKLNGVSKIHAADASVRFKHADGTPAEHKAITNGINFERWVPNHLRVYQKAEILSADGLPLPNYQKGVESLDPQVLRREKEDAKREFLAYLPSRVDQFGNSISIPADAKIAVWSKRVADYKRPKMLFDDPQRLAKILEDGNVHVIMSGKTHPKDWPMKETLQGKVLKIIDANPTLRERVHFVCDYDEEFAEKLVPAIDICFNTPTVLDGNGNQISTEADGTFWKKAMAGGAILISTPDGGVADIDSKAYLRVVGRNYQEEVESLYANFVLAISEIDDMEKLGIRVKAELHDYMPTLSGPRMLKEYLNYAIPPNSPQAA